MQIEPSFLSWLVPLAATGITIGVLAALTAFARNAVALWRDLRGKPDPNAASRTDLAAAISQHAKGCNAVSGMHVAAAIAEHTAACAKARTDEAGRVTAEIFGDIKRLSNSLQKEISSINRAVGRIEGRLRNGGVNG